MGVRKMGLHPQVQGLLELMASQNLPPIEEIEDLESGRQAFNTSSKHMCTREDVFSVEDRVIEGAEGPITLRIYHPNDQKNLPGFVFFHGGGWVIGNIDSHDGLCRTFANAAGCVVISVDYSLAPEAKFPIPVEDCYLATKWVGAHTEELGIDPNAIGVGGDSAGGNLAAVVSHLSAKRGGPSIHSQYLFYPSTGFEPTESYERFGEGYFLTKPTMTWFTEQYLNDLSDALNPLAAPLLIPDEEVSVLPPAYIVTAEFDPLRDGGEQYSQKLKNAGVETTYICYDGMIHGFMSMTAILEDGDRAVKEAAHYFKEQTAIGTK